MNSNANDYLKTEIKGYTGIYKVILTGSSEFTKHRSITMKAELQKPTGCFS